MYDVPAARAQIELTLADLLAAHHAGPRAAYGPGGLHWLSSEESAALVRHWIDDLGAQRHGRLALIRPAVGTSYGEYPPGEIPDWLATDVGPVLVFLQEYRAAGIVRCSWAFVVANMGVLAAVDGNGFAAVSGDLAGVLLVDPAGDGDAPALQIMAWGDVLAGTPE